MSETDPRNEDGEPQTVKDPHEYVNKRRLKGIFDIREEIYDVRKKLQAAQHDPKMSRFDMVSVYRSLVDSYIVETEPLLTQYELGQYYLEEHEYGTATLSPTTRRNERYGRSDKFEVYCSNAEEWFASATEPDETVYEFRGLNSLLETENPLTGVFEISQPRAGRSGHEKVSVAARAQPEKRMLDRMIRSVNNFLAQIGFELDPEESDDPAQI